MIRVYYGWTAAAAAADISPSDSRTIHYRTAFRPRHRTTTSEPQRETARVWVPHYQRRGQLRK